MVELKLETQKLKQRILGIFAIYDSVQYQLMELLKNLDIVCVIGLD